MFPGSDLTSTVQEGIHYLNEEFDASMDLLKLIYESDIEGFDSVINVYLKNGYAPALEELAGLLQDQSHIQSFRIAICLNRAGMHEEAISWLEKGFESHDPDMPYAFLPIEFNNLRSDPRYEALAQRMNLPF